jgi:hypothetical protein
MNHQMDTMNSSTVEVSGWDAKEDFFVEKTNFDPEADGRMEIALRSSLREGCVVFVRVLEQLATGCSFPIAYQAMNIIGREKDGRARVGLKRLRPRALRGYTDLPLHSTATRVA